MSLNDRREITLEVGDKEFTFTLDTALVNKYFNQLTPANKVAPANNLLTLSVKQEELASLRPLLANTVTTLQLAGALLEEYSPDVEIRVKKPSTVQSD